MTTYAMVIDTKTCIGCGDCVVACKTENKVPDGLNRDWVVEATSGTYPNLTTEFRSERCNHCSNPTCVTLCPTGASHLWEDTNIVLVDADKCTGCKACIAACPYDARLVMHPEGYVDKCTFCHHRVDQGLEPYDRFNDRTMRLIYAWGDRGQLDHNQFGMVVLALLRLDDFGEFLRDKEWFARLALSDTERQAILVQGGVRPAQLEFSLRRVALIAALTFLAGLGIGAVI